MRGELDPAEDSVLPLDVVRVGLCAALLWEVA